MSYRFALLILAVLLILGSMGAIDVQAFKSYMPRPTKTVQPTATKTSVPTKTPTHIPTQTATVTPTPTYSVSAFLASLSGSEIAFLKTHEFYYGRTDKPVIMMTYDDGGKAADVEKIMDIYNQYGVKTTFFVMGEWVLKHPDLVRRMVNEGFEVASHGWDHTALTTLSSSAVRKQMVDFLDAMEQVVPGYKVKFIRFPYGSRDNRVRAIAAEYGMQSVMWSGESGGDTSRTFEYATRNMQPGLIVLSHSTRYFDVQATEKIVKYFQSEGYDLVTVSDGMNPDDIYGGE
jgi:peptidoglycan/xylan/chitin deacetylase (PgdA/CDA1 family)